MFQIAPILQDFQITCICGILYKETFHIGCAQGVVVITMPILSGDYRPCPHGDSEGIQTISICDNG